MDEIIGEMLGSECRDLGDAVGDKVVFELD